jgi:hypothetical protein
MKFREHLEGMEMYAAFNYTMVTYMRGNSHLGKMCTDLTLYTDTTLFFDILSMCRAATYL